jgi:hypothetical protein
MHSPKKNPASANWTGSSKATQLENHMNDASGGSILPADSISAQSHAAAASIATAVPDARFCGFNVSTANGKTRKQPMSLAGHGVGVDTPAEYLCDAEDVLAKEPPPSSATYWGVVLQKHPYITPIDGQDHAFVILDLDTKASTAPRDIRIAKLLELAREMDLLTERSHSQKGGHIMFMSPADEAAPKRIKLGNSQEIEIFGLANSAGKSVMLTGDKLKGGVRPIPSLIELLHQAGITDDVIFPPEPAPQPVTTHAIEYTQRPMDDMDKAQLALSHISIAKGDYQTWIDMGMALQHGFGAAGYQLWVQWSSTQPEYKGEEDCKTHWKSFKPNGATSMGTLFHLAKQNGYTPPTTKTERKSAIEDFNSFIQKTAPAPAPEPSQPEAIPDSSIWQEVDLDLNTLHPIDYLIDNFLAHSLMVVAGQPGVGKTTAMLSLAMVISGFTLKDCSLSTEAPRRVIYVTEDVSQVQLSLFSYARHHHLDPNKIREMIHVVEARRSEMPDILLLTQNILKHTTTHENHTLRPYLILDTASATFDIEDENNNSEVAIYMEGIKQTLYTKLNTPIAIVTHTAKSLSTSDDTATARGASAWTGNATLTATLFIDQEERFMTLVKKRYQPLITELRFKTHVNNEVTISRYGKPQDVVCITVTPTESSKMDRQQSAEEEKNEKQNQRAMDKADEACAYVQSVINGHPEGVIIRRGSTASRTIPSDYKTCHQLHWDDVFEHVPGSSRGDVKRAVGSAVFSRFAPDAPASGWVKLG